jgi:hypothetical protein
MKGKEIVSEFASSAMFRGGVALFPVRTAIEIVKRCKALNIRVFGLDGFFLTETTTEPSLENSIDLSKMEANCHELALEFLFERSNSGMYFEVVIPED